jgi:hypothetical protein
LHQNHVCWVGEAVDEDVLRVDDLQLHLAVQDVELDEATPVQKFLVSIHVIEQPQPITLGYLVPILILEQFLLYCPAPRG